MRERFSQGRLVLLAWTAAGLALSAAVALALASNMLNILEPPVAAPSTQGRNHAVRREQTQSDQQHPGGQELSPSTAIALVQRRYDAQVVRAHRIQVAGGRSLYQMRLLSANGTVWTVRIDAHTGRDTP